MKKAQEMTKDGESWRDRMAGNIMWIQGCWRNKDNAYSSLQCNCFTPIPPTLKLGRRSLKKTPMKGLYINVKVLVPSEWMKDY